MVGKRLVNTGGAVAAFDPLQNFETVTYTGNGGTQKITGYIRKGAAFNGSSSLIDTGISGHTLAWGYSGWFNTTATSGTILASLNGSGSSDGLTISMQSGGAVRFLFAVGGTNIVSSGFDVGSGFNDGDWHFFAFTWDGVSGNDVAIRIDNNSYSYTPTINGTTSSDATLKIGRFGISAGGGYLNGKVDQVRIFNKKLSSSELTTLYGETYASSTKSTTDIFGDGSGVALYELDEDASDTGVGFDGTGKSAYFDGSSYVQTSLDLDTYDETWSISAWVRFNFDSSYRGIMGSLDSSAQDGFLIDIGTSGELRFRLRNGSSSVSALASTSTYGDGEWHHIVAVKGSSTNYLYIDGNAETLSASTTNGVSHSIGVRFGDLGYSQYLKGNLDDIRVYDDELSAAEALSIYNSTSIPTDNLLAYYKFESNATDEQGSFDGTWTGAELYKGSPYNGTPTNVNFLGMAFQPDLVWIKDRTVAREHILCDSVRGVNKELTANTTEAEESRGVNSFDTNGFTLDGLTANYNGNNESYVAWCWKAGGTAVSNTDGDITSTVSANPDAGFSIVKYTGNNTNSTVGHGLSSAPELVLYKVLSAAGNWTVYNSTLTDSYYLKLNGTDAQISEIYNIFNGQPDASVLKLGSGGSINGNGNDHIAYCFHSVDGYQKVGSYTGTGSSGNAITTGFQPRWILIKRTDSTGLWSLFDSVRGTTQFLSAEQNTAEQTISSAMTFTSTGFTLTDASSNRNASGGTYIYLAIA